MDKKCKCGRFKPTRKPACKDCLKRAETTAKLMVEVYGENKAPKTHRPSEFHRKNHDTELFRTSFFIDITFDTIA